MLIGSWSRAGQVNVNGVTSAAPAGAEFDLRWRRNRGSRKETSPNVVRRGGTKRRGGTTEFLRVRVYAINWRLRGQRPLLLS